MAPNFVFYVFIFTGHVIISFCCIITLSVNLITYTFPKIIAAILQISFHTTLLVCNSHNVLMIINKWIQGCMASSGTSTISAPVRYLFWIFIIIIWLVNIGKVI